jgi:hypothetical protein
MIKTSTLTPLTEKANQQKEPNLPEFSEPNNQLISTLLNFSKSLDIKKSSNMTEFIILKS